MRIIAFFTLAFLLNACHTKTGSGDIVTEKRSTRDFEGVRVGGSFEVEITKGDNYSVTIEADDNLIGQIETDVKAGLLNIKSRDYNLRDAHLKAFITTPVLNHVDVSAAAILKVNGAFSSDKMASYEASSAGEIHANVSAPEVRTEASSSGEIILTGKTRKFVASASSGGTIDAKNLLAENSTVECSSGATVKVFASVNLDATASSGANVTYRGGANVRKSVSSGANVTAE